MILILIGGLFLWSIQPVETAGNTGIWFLGDLGTHSQADPAEAYDRPGHSFATGIECWSEKPEVDGSTPSLTTRTCL
jgi:hypothetical protein